MISDTLFDAEKDIKEYMKELPECYDDISRELLFVLDVMNCARNYLDKPNNKKELKDMIDRVILVWNKPHLKCLIEGEGE